MAWYNPDDPTQRNWLIGGVVFLLLIVPFRMYLLAPMQEETEALAADVERLEVVNRRASVLSAQGGGDLEERLALYERHVDRLEQLIPAEDEVPALIDDITNRARAVNVNVTGLDPQPRQAGEYYDRTAYNMSVVGEYHAVGRFLADIASLPRIVTPVQVDLRPFPNPQQYPDLEGPVVATFLIETFVLPDPSARPPATDVGG